MAATNWKRAGNSACRAAREMTIRPLSSGSRKASSAARGNSGSSSRKRNAVMRQQGLARSRRRAATDQRRGRRGVVRRAQHALAPARSVEDASHAEDGFRLQRRLVRELGQQAAETLGEHRFAGSRRPDHEQAQLAGRGDFERTLGASLTLDVTQIGQGCRFATTQRLRFSQGAGIGSVAGQQGADDVEQVCGAAHRQAADRGRLVGARVRQNQGAGALDRGSGAMQGQPHGQCAVHRGATRRRAKARPRIRTPRVGLRRCVRTPRGCQGRSAGRSGPIPSAGRPARG